MRLARLKGKQAGRSASRTRTFGGQARKHLTKVKAASSQGARAREKSKKALEGCSRVALHNARRTDPAMLDCEITIDAECIDLRLRYGLPASSIS